MLLLFVVVVVGVVVIVGGGGVGFDLFGRYDHCEDNVRIADRLRPSNEQQAAQKGCQRLEMLLESALRHCKAEAVLIVNLTGYVEELALAVAGQSVLRHSFLISFLILCKYEIQDV